MKSKIILPIGFLLILSTCLCYGQENKNNKPIMTEGDKNQAKRFSEDLVELGNEKTTTDEEFKRKEIEFNSAKLQTKNEKNKIQQYVNTHDSWTDWYDSKTHAFLRREEHPEVRKVYAQMIQKYDQAVEKEGRFEVEYNQLSSKLDNIQSKIDDTKEKIRRIENTFGSGCNCGKPPIETSSNEDISDYWKCVFDYANRQSPLGDNPKRGTTVTSNDPSVVDAHFTQAEYNQKIEAQKRLMRPTQKKESTEIIVP
ncbi:MAG TPA: hypothetical protein VK588_13245, partial [Chitinophagaceae bacterium]|nr:hypothetical protein [Chitinophagaceae bacterium]